MERKEPLKVRRLDPINSTAFSSQPSQKDVGRRPKKEKKIIVIKKIESPLIASPTITGDIVSLFFWFLLLLLLLRQSEPFVVVFFLNILKKKTKENRALRFMQFDRSSLELIMAIVIYLIRQSLFIATLPCLRDDRWNDNRVIYFSNHISSNEERVLFKFDVIGKYRCSLEEQGELFFRFSLWIDWFLFFKKTEIPWGKGLVGVVRFRIQSGHPDGGQQQQQQKHTEKEKKNSLKVLASSTVGPLSLESTVAVFCFVFLCCVWVCFFIFFHSIFLFDFDFVFYTISMDLDSMDEQRDGRSFSG